MREDLTSESDTAKRWRRLDVFVTIVFFALALVGSRFKDMEWRRELGSSAQLLITGMFLEACGISFLLIKWKRGRVVPENIREVKWLLFEAAMVIGGIVCFVQAVS